MAQKKKLWLNGFFETGKRPTEGNYIDLIDSLATFNVGIFILTGRFESTRGATEEWLNYYKVFYDKLVMKPYKDTYVKSNVWKEKQLLKFIEENNLKERA